MMFGAVTMRFAVLGDIHYAVHEYHTRRRSSDLDRYERARLDYYQTLTQEVRESRPDFLVQLGDLLEGSWDDPEQAKTEMREALAWLVSACCPVFPIRGNHDDGGPAALACDAVLAPYLSGLFLSDRTGFSYEFTRGGDTFLFVDCRESYERPETRQWLGEAADRARNSRRLFVFAHQPIFPVSRVYFTDPPYLDVIRHCLKDCAIEAYFCGHTHNQAIAFHPHLARHGILQVKTAVIGSLGSDPVPLDQARALLEPDSRYYGGYLEDTLPSWFLVDVDANGVRLTWHRIGAGVEAVLAWSDPARAEWETPPPERPLPAISDEELSHLRSGRIHMAFHDSADPEKQVLLNGVAVGAAPGGGSYAPRNVVKLSPAHLALVQRNNRVELTNPHGERLVWGGVYLEVETAGGRRVRSTPGHEVYDTGFDGGSGRSPVILPVPPGQTLGPVTVQFKE